MVFLDCDRTDLDNIFHNLSVAAGDDVALLILDDPHVAQKLFGVFQVSEPGRLLEAFLVLELHRVSVVDYC
jgi:hypothetical protein